MVHSFTKAEGDKMSRPKTGCRVSSGSSGSECMFSNEELSQRGFRAHLHCTSSPFDPPPASSLNQYPRTTTPTLGSHFSLDNSSANIFTPSKLNHARQSCWNRVLKTFRYRTIKASHQISPALSTRFLRMALRKYHLLAACLVIFSLSCLLASIVISRQVGDLDFQSSGSRLESLERQKSSDELELRNIELIDLIECDKTFAYTKIQLQVTVPQTSIQYRQTPLFLHNRQVRQSMIGGGTPKRFILASVRSPSEEVSSNIGNYESNARGTLTENLDKSHQMIALDTLGQQIRVSNNFETRIARLSILDEPGGVVQEALHSMKLSSRSVNKSLTDCFLVDTDKRFSQKVALEDQFRLVAGTRRVSFETMLKTIIECRQLTWSGEQDLIKIKQTPGVEFGAPLRGPLKTNDQQPPTERPLNFITDFLSGWFRPSAAKSQLESNQILPNSSLTSFRQSQSTQMRFRKINQEIQDPQKQGSYLNMGISMVSGIVPNTLWCGLGDGAANYSELGAEYKVDTCCRAHDHCPIRMRPFSAEYGLINYSMSTRSHCDCDIDFDDCLTTVNSTLSNVIKVLYFRFVGVQCIDAMR